MSVLFEEALKLPVPERRKLADDIYESIEESEEVVTLTPAQMAELERRIEYSRLHPDEYYSWEEVRERALARK
ncbi:MAG: addiction module protein [Pyrinomonadaceae bacterium]